MLLLAKNGTIMPHYTLKDMILEDTCWRYCKNILDDMPGGNNIIALNINPPTTLKIFWKRWIVISVLMQFYLALLIQSSYFSPIIRLVNDCKFFWIRSYTFLFDFRKYSTTKLCFWNQPYVSKLFKKYILCQFPALKNVPLNLANNDRFCFAISWPSFDTISSWRKLFRHKYIKHPPLKQCETGSMFVIPISLQVVKNQPVF